MLRKGAEWLKSQLKKDMIYMCTVIENEIYADVTEEQVKQYF